MVSKQTVTLANSIVGVSVLAMPFCFKQCGIVLATLMLVLGAVITRTVCYFLLKAGTITRRRTYEMLAWDTFGHGGKFMVEISIIGFLIGTLIAFFVVMGELAPEIVSEVFDVDNNFSLRNIIMAGLSLFVALPLGLLRNIDSLSSVSTASMLFYGVLVIKILSEGLGPLFSGSYLSRVDFWRPAGVLQCIPIFSMALSCQTQIFGIYESLPEPSVQKMNEVVKHAVTICTMFYFSVGFFGYIAFCHQSFGGNILMTFSPSWTTQLIKLSFLMTVVFSVPLVVFPCRASLHSLIFRRMHMHHSLHDISTNYIPDGRLKFLTVIIIAFTLIVGILIPNIELVLGLVGSTTGTVICIIIPSAMFIKVTTKRTTERLLAQVILFTGVIMMVVSTYATLYAVEQAQSQPHVPDPTPDQVRAAEIIKAITQGPQSKASFQTPVSKIGELNNELKIKLEHLDHLHKAKELLSSQMPSKKTESSVQETKNDQSKRKPNVPEPMDQHNNNKAESLKEKQVQVGEIAPAVKDGANDFKMINEQEIVKKVEAVKKENAELKAQDGLNVQPAPVKAEAPPKNENAELRGNDNLDVNKPNQPPLDPKDDKESIFEKDQAADILKKLEVHQETQKKLLEEQKKILEELKEHHEQDLHRQDRHDNDPAPQLPQSDNLINAVQKENHDRPEPINQGMIDQKVEVFKQEKLIEKFSENIEREKENVKIIENIEAGLNKEMGKAADSKPEVPSERKMEQPQPEHNELKPIPVGETVGRILQKAKSLKSADERAPDPKIIVQPQGKRYAPSSIPVPIGEANPGSKPIPMERKLNAVDNANNPKPHVESPAIQQPKKDEPQPAAYIKQEVVAQPSSGPPHKPSERTVEKKSTKISVNAVVHSSSKAKAGEKVVDRDI